MVKQKESSSLEKEIRAYTAVLQDLNRSEDEDDEHDRQAEANQFHRASGMNQESFEKKWRG